MFQKCVRLAMALCILACLAVAVFADNDSQKDWKFQTFDVPGFATVCFPLGINNHGEVVGIYDDAYGLLHGFLYTDGKFQTIDYPGALMSGSGGINDKGVITGVYFDFLGFQHGYRLSRGQFFSIDDPLAIQTTGIEFELGPGLGTAAFGLNNENEIVGEYADADGVAHAFLRSHDQFTTIDVPGVLPIPGLGNNAIGINDADDVTGVYYTPDVAPAHGFLMHAGHFTTIDFPGSGGSFGTQTNGINNRGDIVGVYSDTMDNGHGFLIHKDAYISLDFPGALFTECHCINDKGVITGSYYDAMGIAHGFLAQRKDR